jgi:hypothetical protein
MIEYVFELPGTIHQHSKHHDWQYSVQTQTAATATFSIVYCCWRISLLLLLLLLLLRFIQIRHLWCVKKGRNGEKNLTRVIVEKGIHRTTSVLMSRYLLFSIILAQNGCTHKFALMLLASEF